MKEKNTTPGQEHATPGQEREKLEELLNDTAKNKFDAVIVCDASRWSRDNARSKAGLETLRNNGIRFFVGSSEFDLHSPQHKLFLGMSTEMNEFFASEQALKSMINKIERAKKGIPSNGRLPYGRIYDKKSNQWSIDKSKAKEIEWAAEQYLNGESLVTIAKSLNMNFTNLWKILTRRSSDSWNIAFKSSRLNIDQTVSLKIPRLLPEEIINKILERAASNKTYTHGHIKHHYLLGRMVFCSECGYAMIGQTNHGNRRYYRHANQNQRARKCITGGWVSAEALESAVIANLFSLFGDVRAIEKAVERAFPDLIETRKLESQIPELEGKLTKIKTQKKNLINAITEGTLDSKDAQDKMSELKASEELINKNLDSITKLINSLPSKQKIQRDAQSLAGRIKKSAIKTKFTGYEHFKNMNYEDKKHLVEFVFAGIDSEGNRRGVYMKKDSQGNWTFIMKGNLMSEEILDVNGYAEELLDDTFDPERDLSPEDFVKKETKSKKVSISALSLQAQGLPVFRSLSGIPRFEA